MKNTVLVLSLLISTSAMYAQGPVKALADQLDDIAMVHTQPIEVVIKADQAMIQAPVSTYLLEVINKKGSVVMQDPFNTAISVNVKKWEPGIYTVLAHTFNGLEQVEFSVNMPKNAPK